MYSRDPARRMVTITSSSIVPQLKFVRKQHRDGLQHDMYNYMATEVLAFSPWGHRSSEFSTLIVWKLNVCLN